MQYFVSLGVAALLIIPKCSLAKEPTPKNLRYAAITLTIPKDLKIRAEAIAVRKSEKPMKLVEGLNRIFNSGSETLDVLLKDIRGNETSLGIIKVTPGPAVCPDCGNQVGNSSSGQQRYITVPLISGLDVLLIKDKGKIVFSQSLLKIAADDLRFSIKGLSDHLPAKMSTLDSSLEDKEFLTRANAILKECASVPATERSYCEGMADLVQAVL